MDRGLEGGRGVGLREGSSIVEQLERRRDRSAPCDVLQREIVKKRNLLEPLRVCEPAAEFCGVRHKRHAVAEERRERCETEEKVA